jgi:NAD(P)-dependent dehydrogenase (short-subunit alcohol dehydrogenase family)
MKLSGNTILITGAGSGIGRGLAEALNQRKNQVIIAGRRKDRLMEVAAANPGMAWIELNIEDPASISAVATKLTSEHPKLNVLINNAGIMNIDDVSSAVDEKLLVSTLTTNLMGPIRMTGALIEHLKRQTEATVIKHHIGPWIRSAGSYGRILVNQGGNAFVHHVPSVQAQRHAGQGFRVSSAVGADRPAWQQQRTPGNAAGRVHRGDDASPRNRCR